MLSRAARRCGAVRFLSSQAGEVQVTTLPSGITVVSQEADSSPTSSLAIVVNSGSRAETAGSRGVSHLMKEVAFGSTETRSQLAIIRTTEMAGSVLSAQSDREAISYTGKCLRSNVRSVMENLADTVTGQRFTSWEVAAAKARLAEQVASLPAKEIAMDALHQGAFRTGLGAPVAASPFKVAGFTPQHLADYASANFTAGNITVAGSGVDHAELVSVVGSCLGDLETVDTAPEPSVYVGGLESRVESASSGTGFAIGFEGAAAGTPEAAACDVLAKILVPTAVLKYGTASGAVSANVTAASPSASAQGFNKSYTDAGIVGVYFESPSDVATAAITGGLEAVYNKLRGNIDESEFNVAKSQLAHELFSMSTDESVAFIAAQSSKQPLTPAQYAEQISAVSFASVKAAAAKAIASKPTIAAAGDIDNAPFFDELKL